MSGGSLYPGNDSQKTPLAQSLHKLGTAKANDAIEALGKGLPCTIASVVGTGVVEVSFSVNADPASLPNVTMPVSKFAAINYPLVVGAPGVALSADLLLGGLSGLGTGTPSLGDTTANLAAMMFFPMGTTGQVAVDPEALELFGNIMMTATTLSFFGATKVDQQSLPSAATDEATTQALANAIRSALIAYGLAT